MFGKLLVANRGEIACRVMRTARRMGIRTVAVFSEADAKALHVEMADEAVAIGPPPARESYLRIDKIIDAAKRAGADAIHPGYGFLSENADFAEACAAAGIVFVGPTPAAIRAMGSKADAKRLMQAAGVPLVPGYHGEDQSEALLEAEATKIGFPVLIKASAGGGGRGMRAVERAEEFLAQLAAARREAEAAFGDGRVLLEKYLQRPRHIEVQLLGDTHGTLLHLGTRDCSIQRRHQKIVEEAPAPGLSDVTRERIHEAALSAGRAVNYTNAGTVEFIAEGTGPDPDFYFMEMNTRLQVEHPVTEQAYGVDLVEQQLLVAAGAKLTLTQKGLQPRQHAIEVRLCAEDPLNDFRPTVGRIHRWHMGARFGEDRRCDSGFKAGDTIGSDYDNLIAKVIAWGSNRDAALGRLAATLASMALTGIGTNLELLRRILAHPSFIAADLDTGFLERHRADVLPPPGDTVADAVLVASIHAHTLDRTERDADALRGTDPRSPWHQCRGFRLNGTAKTTYRLLHQGQAHEVQIAHEPGGHDQVVMPDGTLLSTVVSPRDIGGISRPLAPDDVIVQVSFGAGVSARVINALILQSGARRQVTLQHDPRPHDLLLVDPHAPPDATATAADRIAAPIPGTVLRVDVAEGDVVARGKVLVVMEAMKTEIRIAAPADGTVARVLVKPGDMVQDGMELVQLSHDDAKPGA